MERGLDLSRFTENEERFCQVRILIGIDLINLFGTYSK